MSLLLQVVTSKNKFCMKNKHNDPLNNKAKNKKCKTWWTSSKHRP